ncbi:MAG: M23 family metallopeptidase [Bacteriovoracaceae bacterium]|nr:M23 family metallopeptidase [Bacteriovoracaceae bacterium]
MDKYYTLVIIPEKTQASKTVKISALTVRLVSVFLAIFLITLGVFYIDYWKLMSNVVDGKYVTKENKILREQLQIMQMKMNALGQDLERISIFEKKIRTITGLDREKLTRSYFETLKLLQDQNSVDTDNEASGSSASSGQSSSRKSRDLILDKDDPETINPAKTMPYRQKKRSEKLKNSDTMNEDNVPSAPSSSSPSIQAPAAPPVENNVPSSGGDSTTFIDNKTKPQLRSIPYLKLSQEMISHLFWAKAHAQNAASSGSNYSQGDGPLTPVLQMTSSLLENERYRELLRRYGSGIREAFGLSDEYTSVTNKISTLNSRAEGLANQLATFDYTYELQKNFAIHLEGLLGEVDQNLIDRESMILSTPVLMPTNGWITSFFGPRLNPYTSQLKMHEGIDIGAPFGAPIVAPADGVVVFAGIKPGFGKHVQIDHGYGIETMFAHSEKLHVKTGQVVSRGLLLANVGSTGHSTGPHLHYEVRINGVPVDPFYFILE